MFTSWAITSTLTTPNFRHTLTRFRDNRFQRGKRMLEKLAAMDMPLEWDRVVAIANGGAIGRPHIARAMLEAGYVESVKDAFNRYISNDGPGLRGAHAAFARRSRSS